MHRAKIDPVTKEVSCPTCDGDDFMIFRQDKVSDFISLHHCRCMECNQLFNYYAKKAEVEDEFIGRHKSDCV